MSIRYDSPDRSRIDEYKLLFINNLPSDTVTKVLFGRRRRASIRKALLVVGGARPLRATNDVSLASDRPKETPQARLL
jgi:hypothetical protein